MLRVLSRIFKGRAFIASPTPKGVVPYSLGLSRCRRGYPGRVPWKIIQPCKGCVRDVYRIA